MNKMSYIHTHLYLISLVCKMKFKEQQQQLKVKNYDKILCRDGEKSSKHGDLFPDSIRALIVGPSNCGKTNVMISLLEERTGLAFSNVYIYSKSLHQPKYEYLKILITKIKEIGFYTFADNCNVIPPSEAKPDSVFIFDDITSEKQDSVRSYFSMGRHNDIDCFFLCQTYSFIKKQLIRDNANFLIIFKQDELNLKHIYNDHVNVDMSFDIFRDICAECWRDDHGFVVVDKGSDFGNGRYRKGFHTFIEV